MRYRLFAIMRIRAKNPDFTFIFPKFCYPLHVTVLQAPVESGATYREMVVDC